MGLKYFRHKDTGEVKRTLKGSPGEDWVEVIKAPNSKFMEVVNAATGKSKIKDLKKQLTERARNYSRDVELDDNIQVNREVDRDLVKVKQSFLNKDGKRRRKIDDI